MAIKVKFHTMPEGMTPEQEVLIKFSIMSGKLAGLNAINTSPNTNPFCQKMKENDCAICSKCYSIKMTQSYRKSADMVWQESGKILSNHRFDPDRIPFLNMAFLRISAHGELINETHFLNILAIAKGNPHCTVVMWTKRTDIVSNVLDRLPFMKPDNLIIIFSVPRINDTRQDPPKHFDKTFSVVEPDHELAKSVNCGARRCVACQKCYQKDNGITQLIEILK